MSAHLDRGHSLNQRVAGAALTRHRHCQRLITQPVRKFPGISPPRSRGNARCSPAWYDQATAARRGDCRFSCKSARPWSAAWNACRACCPSSANVGDPPIDDPGILTGREVRTATDSARKNIILVVQTTFCNPELRRRLTGLIGQFKLDRLAGFLLDDHSPILDPPS